MTGYRERNDGVCWSSLEVQPHRCSILPTAHTNFPEWDARILRDALNAAKVALWSWNVESDEITLDELGFDLWGMPRETPMTFDRLSRHIHPDDRDRVKTVFAGTPGLHGAYETDFRIMFDGGIRWISARGEGNDPNLVGPLVFGIFLDVTQRRQAEEAHELLAGEMGHRVKNLLAVAVALVALASRSARTAGEMAGDLTRRLTALGRAHELVRPNAAGYLASEAKAALLGDLFAALLTPYDNLGACNERVRVSGPQLAVGEAGATTLALVVHELATNSLKYGALSVATGTLDVACKAQVDDVVVVWTERGGPGVAVPAAVEGFGSRMVDRSMSSQLGGSVGFEWSKEGVVVTLRMNKDRLAA